MTTKPIILEVDNINILGQLYLPDNKSQYPTVCIAHGIPSGIPPDANDSGYPGLAEKICHEGFAVLIFNCRYPRA